MSRTFLTWSRHFNKSCRSKICFLVYTTGATYVAGNAYLSVFTPVFSAVCVDLSIVFCVVFCILLFVLLSFFLLTSVFSVLRLTATGYPFGIFKLFIHMIYMKLKTFEMSTVNSTVQEMHRPLHLKGEIKYKQSSLHSNLY